MASLTLKNLPDELMDQLRRRATRNHRSLMKEVLHLLDRALAQPERSWPTRLGEPGATYGQPRPDGHAPLDTEMTREHQLQAWRELCGRWESDEPIDEEVAAIGAARTGGRAVEL